MCPTPARDGHGNSADTAQPGICVICQENIASPCEAQPCRHKNFDHPCLATWLELRAACPLCKGIVDEVRYISKDEDGQTDLRTYKVPKRPGADEESDRREPTPVPVEEEWLRRRRHIYQEDLYALHVGSNRHQMGESQYTELLPELFMTRPEFVSRARKWLQRELRIFDFLHTDVADPNNIDLTRPTRAEWVREFIIFLLKTVDIQDHSNEFEDRLSTYLGRKTARHLLHELRAWLRSPFTKLEDWDRVVQYSVENSGREPYETIDRREWDHREPSPRRKHISHHEYRIIKGGAKTPRNCLRTSSSRAQKEPQTSLAGHSKTLVSTP